MRWHHAVCVALTLVTTAGLAQTGNDLSLPSAVQAALENQPVMRSAELAIDLADKRVTEARSTRLPALKITETITRGNNPVFVFGSLLEQSRFGPQNFSLNSLNNPASITNIRSVVSANMSAFDGTKTSAHIAEANIVRNHAVLQKTAAEQRLRFEVLRLYLGVLVAEANRQVANEAVRVAESDVNRTKDRIDAGLAVESDRFAAQVQLSEFISQQIEAEGNLATAIVALNVAIGASASNRYNLTGALVKKNFVLPGQDELIRRATLYRPDYIDTNSGIQLAERQVSERRSDYLPELNVFGSFGSSGRNWATGSTDYAVGAGITINLFDPGRPSRISQARLQQSLAQTERDRLRDQIIVEVARAYHQYRTAVQYW